MKIADRYGVEKAALKVAEDAVNATKAELAALNRSKVRGDFYTVTVTDTKPRATVDYDALLADLVPDQGRRERLIAAHTSYGEPGVRINLTGPTAVPVELRP